MYSFWSGKWNHRTAEYFRSESPSSTSTQSGSNWARLSKALSRQVFSISREGIFFGIFLGPIIVPSPSVSEGSWALSSLLSLLNLNNASSQPPRLCAELQSPDQFGDLSPDLDQTNIMQSA